MLATGIADKAIIYLQKALIESFHLVVNRSVTGYILCREYKANKTTTTNKKNQLSEHFIFIYIGNQFTFN